MPDSSLFADHWEFIMQIIVIVSGAVALWFRINARIDKMCSEAKERDSVAKQERAAMSIRLEQIEEDIRHINDTKMPRTECAAIHTVLSDVLNSLRAEVRELNHHMVELATLMKRNGGH